MVGTTAPPYQKYHGVKGDEVISKNRARLKGKEASDPKIMDPLPSFFKESRLSGNENKPIDVILMFLVLVAKIILLLVKT